MSPDLALAYWRKALTLPIGLSIATNDRRWLSRILYAARKAEKDPELDQVMLCLPPPPHVDEIWLCRKDADELP